MTQAQEEQLASLRREVDRRTMEATAMRVLLRDIAERYGHRISHEMRCAIDHALSHTHEQEAS